MIRCKYPIEDEPSNLNEFFSTLTRRVKFSDFEHEGERLFNHWQAHDAAVLVLTSESVIDVRTTIGLGEMLLAEVNNLGQLRLLSWLDVQFQHRLSTGFQKAAQESKSR